MIKFVNQEIDPDYVWISISKGLTVRAAVLTACGKIYRGVYKLEDEAISTVTEMVKCAEESGNVRFYILEEAKEDNNVTG